MESDEGASGLQIQDYESHDAPGVQRQFRVQHTTLDRELLEEELETVAAIYVVDEQNAFPFDQPEFQDHVGQEELVDFGTSAEKQSACL